MMLLKIFLNYILPLRRLKSNISLNLKLDPKQFKSQLNDSIRDIRNIGHWGCGDLQLIIKENDDLTLAKDLIKKAYDEN